MDIHKRYRTDAHQDIKCRFTERLILSLADCKRCLLVDDNLSILPLSKKTASIDPIDVSQIVTPNFDKLVELKKSLQDTPPAGALVNLCKTLDQANAVARFVELLAEKELRPPTSLTAARGRGKSAAMGLATAAAVYFGYSQIYVSSPTPENLITYFEFILKGFDALAYQEHLDYTIIRSTNTEFNKAIIKINLHRNNRQTIQFISPKDTHLLNAADLLIIDEAAAIPLSFVKKMLGPYLVFMASTINGYEGTGRSLSLKLLSEIQKENNAPLPIKLEESIRYDPGDSIETWLTSLLCLDVQSLPCNVTGYPTPDACELYYIDRDALFSYHKAAEHFLQKIMAIFVSSHYKNTPNDLQMLSDAPAHHLFCLLGPISKVNQLPDVLVVIQVCLEGKISQSRINDSLSSRSAGDLIPWNVSEQFNDREFPKLSGARIIRIATSPNHQRMGYGKRALQLLMKYYEGELPCLNENEAAEETQLEEITDESTDLLNETIQPRKKIPTLLKRLNERKPESLDWIGTSFGITQELLKFWKSQKFVPVYLSQKENDITGEHSCVMLANLNSDQVLTKNWLTDYHCDFRRRFLKILPKSFASYTTALALSILENKSVSIKQKPVDSTELNFIFISDDFKRLESYVRNHVEYRLIIDLTSDISLLVFLKKLPTLQIDSLQRAILLGIGVMNKTIDKIASELNMPSSQLLAKFSDTMKKVKKVLDEVQVGVEQETEAVENENLNKLKDAQPIKISIDEELDLEVKSMELKQRKLNKIKGTNSQFSIKGDENEWKKALQNLGDKNLVVSIKSGVKRNLEDLSRDVPTETDNKKSKKMKFKNKKKFTKEKQH